MLIPCQIPYAACEQRGPLGFSAKALTSDSHQVDEAEGSLSFPENFQLGRSAPVEASWL